jgi:hypothetical protein
VEEGDEKVKPIKFPEQTCTYAEDQPQYIPLPVHRTEDGNVTSCWALSWRERIKLLFTGRMWFQVMTFNQPLQPQLPSADKPAMSKPRPRRDREDIPPERRRDAHA